MAPDAKDPALASKNLVWHKIARKWHCQSERSQEPTKSSQIIQSCVSKEKVPNECSQSQVARTQSQNGSSQSLEA